jgi:tetratricopeptide (TPR) repeat protein
MIRHGLFIGLFVLHLNGAIGQDLSSYRTRLTEAEKLLFEDPAAVKPELDELLKISQGKPDTLVGMNHRLLSIYFGMTGMADSGIFHIHKAIELTPENRKASALKILSLLHMGLKEFDAADSLLKAALKANARFADTKERAILLGELASNYKYRVDYVSAIPLLIEALEIVKERGEENERYALILRQKLANTYNDLNDPVSAIPELQLLAEGFLDIKDKSNYSATCLALASACFTLDRYSAANSWRAKAESGFSEIGNPEMLALTRMLAAQIALETSDLPRALTESGEAYRVLLELKSARLVEVAPVYLNALEQKGMNEEGQRVTNDPVLNKLVSQVGGSLQLDFLKAALPFVRLSGNKVRLLEQLERIVFLEDTLRIPKRKMQAQEIQANYKMQLNQQAEKILRQENILLTQQKDLQRKQLFIWLSVAGAAIIVLVFWGRQNRLKRLYRESQLVVQAETNRFLEMQLEMESKERERKEELIALQNEELRQYQSKSSGSGDSGKVS